MGRVSGLIFTAACFRQCLRFGGFASRLGVGKVQKQLRLHGLPACGVLNIWLGGLGASFSKPVAAHEGHVARTHACEDAQGGAHPGKGATVGCVLSQTVTQSRVAADISTQSNR